MRSTVVIDPDENKAYTEHIDSYSNFEYSPISKDRAIEITTREIERTEKSLNELKTKLASLHLLPE